MDAAALGQWGEAQRMPRLQAAAISDYSVLGGIAGRKVTPLTNFGRFRRKGEFKGDIFLVNRPLNNRDPCLATTLNG